MSLQGKVALITDGTTGVGLATARVLIADGAVVYLNAVQSHTLETAAKRLGISVFPVPGDVSNADDLDRLFSAIEGRHERLDIVVINASQTARLRLSDITAKNLEDHCRFGVAAVIFTVQQALPLMSAGGTIVLVGSAGDTQSNEGYALYSASKAALRSFARSLTRELGSRGIRINVVSPGPTQNGDLEKASEDALEALRRSIPLGRLVRVEEVAAAVRFLASDESSFIAGAEICVDGGMLQT